MAIYAIGDVQGCALPLEALLEQIAFDPTRDQLWFTGDLVNRGAHSLETLRLVLRFKENIVTVLGNHDLHLLAIAAGVRAPRPGDTLTEILRAPECDELLHWLRHQPLLYCDKTAQSGSKTLLVHAGVYPGWTRKQACRLAREVETILRGDAQQYQTFLKKMYGQKPRRWKKCADTNPTSEGKKKWRRARFITNAFTRMRYCTPRGALNFTHKGAPDKNTSHANLIPWYAHPKMRCKNWRIIFGHWSALGFSQSNNRIGLDSGCVWGGKLTALRLDGADAGRAWQFQCK